MNLLENINLDNICDAFINQDKSKMAYIPKTLQMFLVPTKEQMQKIMKGKIQAYTDTGTGVSTDFERVLRDSFNVFMETNNFDLGWEKAFKTVPVATGHDSWEIHTVESGLTFKKIKEGQRLDVYGVSGTKTTVYVEKRGGAIGWTDEMLRFRKIAAMLDRMEIFRNRYWENKANEHYALLAAATVGNLTTYQGAAADGQLRRDIKTINTAAYDLGNATKDSGYGDTATARLLLYANPLYKERIEAAFTAMTPGMAGALGSAEPIMRNVERVYTFNSSVTTTPFFVLPGNKLQKAEVMAPTNFSDNDILTLQYIQSVWSYYGAIVGDTNQVRGFKLS